MRAVPRPRSCVAISGRLARHRDHCWNVLHATQPASSFAAALSCGDFRDVQEALLSQAARRVRSGTANHRRGRSFLLATPQREAEADPRVRGKHNPSASTRCPGHARLVGRTTGVCCAASHRCLYLSSDEQVLPNLDVTHEYAEHHMVCYFVISPAAAAPPFCACTHTRSWDIFLCSDIGRKSP